MFMLESHLSPAQNQVIAEVQTMMAQLNVNVFLTGGALRDMMAGLPVRDLNFTMEGSPAKLLRALEKQVGVQVVNADETRKSYELVFPNGVLAELSMARVERVAKPGGKPKVTPATIHEDLKGRDFTINSLAISLAKGSRGLLLDPTNGLSDFNLRELRTVTSHTLVDDPSRVLKLVTLEARLGFQMDERTKRQYESAREAGYEKLIAPEALRRELVKIGEEINPLPILEAMEKHGLLELYFAGFRGAKLNAGGFQKMQKLRGLVPFGTQMKEDRLALFLFLVSENWTPKEKTAFAKNCKLTKREMAAWKGVETKSKALGVKLKSAKLRKPSQIYATAQEGQLEQLLLLLYKSPLRLVQERIKNYFLKYLPAAMEVTDEAVVAAGGNPATPKGQTLKKQLIAAKLDARPRKAPTAGEPAYSHPGAL